MDMAKLLGLAEQPMAGPSSFERQIVEGDSFQKHGGRIDVSICNLERSGGCPTLVSNNVFIMFVYRKLLNELMSWI